MVLLKVQYLSNILDAMPLGVNTGTITVVKVPWENPELSGEIYPSQCTASHCMIKHMVEMLVLTLVRWTDTFD